MKKILLLSFMSISICFVRTLNAAAQPEITEDLIKNGNVDEIKSRLQAGADANKIVRGMRYTPLMAAACHNKPEVARVLLAHGARINEKSSEDWDTTAVMIAASTDRPDMVRLLIAKGADLTVVSELQETAIRCAAQRKAWLCLGIIRPTLYAQEKRPVIRELLILAKSNRTSDSAALTGLRRLPDLVLKKIFADILCTSDVETAMQIDTSNEPPEDWLEEKLGPTSYANYMLWQVEVRQQLWTKIILLEKAIQRTEQ